MADFGSEIAGRTFKRGKTVFMVMGIKPYPRDLVSPQYRRVLGVPPGTLVAISYRGALIPNIAVQGGVVRLTKIAVLGSIISTPQAISDALGIKHDYHPYTLHRVE